MYSLYIKFGPKFENFEKICWFSISKKLASETENDHSDNFSMFLAPELVGIDVWIERNDPFWAQNKIIVDFIEHNASANYGVFFVFLRRVLHKEP